MRDGFESLAGETLDVSMLISDDDLRRREPFHLADIDAVKASTIGPVVSHCFNCVADIDFVFHVRVCFGVIIRA